MYYSIFQGTEPIDEPWTLLERYLGRKANANSLSTCLYWQPFSLWYGLHSSLYALVEDVLEAGRHFIKTISRLGERFVSTYAQGCALYPSPRYQTNYENLGEKLRTQLLG